MPGDGRNALNVGTGVCGTRGFALDFVPLGNARELTLDERYLTGDRSCGLSRLRNGA